MFDRSLEFVSVQSEPATCTSSGTTASSFSALAALAHLSSKSGSVETTFSTELRSASSTSFLMSSWSSCRVAPSPFLSSGTRRRTVVKTIAETRHPEKIMIRLPDTEYLQNWAGHVSVSHAKKRNSVGPGTYYATLGEKEGLLQRQDIKLSD